MEGEHPVWTVDTRHAPMFWFPRDCPRGCIWTGPATSGEDRERFFGQSAAKRVHVVEAAWLEPIRTCRLFAYRITPSIWPFWRQVVESTMEFSGSRLRNARPDN
jgi:hypothetical protein